MPEVVESGKLIYVSGITPSVRGDVPTQTRNILEQVQQSLASAGSSLDRVVSVLVFIRAASDFGAMNDAYRTFWKGDFPTRTTIVVDLSSPGTLVEMSLVSVAAGADRTIVHPRDWVQSPSPYSYALRTGDTVFLSGLVSRNGRDNSVVTGDVAQQTRVIFDNAGELLHDKADWYAMPSDVEKVTICRLSGARATDACKHQGEMYTVARADGTPQLVPASGLVDQDEAATMQAQASSEPPVYEDLFAVGTVPPDICPIHNPTASTDATRIDLGTSSPVAAGLTPATQRR